MLIPVYNERETIRTVVERVLATQLHHEVIIVDDASTDGTRDVLLELDQLPGVRVFMHGYNKGKGAALHTAFEHLTGDIVLIQDADLEYNPADYAALLAPIEAGEADVVFGSRFLVNRRRQDPSWLHRFGNSCSRGCRIAPLGWPSRTWKPVTKYSAEVPCADGAVRGKKIWLRTGVYCENGPSEMPIPRSPHLLSQSWLRRGGKKSMSAMAPARSIASSATRGSTDSRSRCTSESEGHPA